MKLCQWRSGHVVVLVIGVIAATLGVANDVHAQGKIRIAVMAFENKAKSPYLDPSWKIGEGLAEILTSELSKTGQFIVVERLALSDIVREQELGPTGERGRLPAGLPHQDGNEQVPLRGELNNSQPAFQRHPSRLSPMR